MVLFGIGFDLKNIGFWYFDVFGLISYVIDNIINESVKCFEKGMYMSFVLFDLFGKMVLIIGFF